jgi:Fanconi-associated nuclease 1
MDAFVRRLPRDKNDRPSPALTDVKQAESPRKRVKREEIPDSESEGAEPQSFDLETSPRSKPGRRSHADGEDEVKRDGVTDIEVALPSAGDDENAIEEYEAFKASQSSAAEDGPQSKPSQTWVRASSSIYVDAFNLALDTVLDEESPLFSDREMMVFRQWKELSYEAQYL